MTECMLGVYCLSCLCCLGGGPGFGLITHPGRTSMSVCVQKSMYVIQRLIPSSTGRGSVRPGRRESSESTYKGEVKNLANEIMRIFNELFKFKTSDEWQHWKMASSSLYCKDINLRLRSHKDLFAFFTALPSVPYLSDCFAIFKLNSVLNYLIY